MILRRPFWYAAMLLLLIVTGILAIYVRPTYWLTCVSDAVSCGLWALAVAAMIRAAWLSSGRARVFWLGFAGGAVLAGVNLAAWSYYDIFLRRTAPDPFWADIPLFLQPIPMMAAVALQPHRRRQTPKFYLSTLNFLILLLWWVYVYCFRIFPHEYVVFNSEAFNRYYNILYIFEFVILLGALGWSWLSTSGNWRKLYFQLFFAIALYILAFQALNSALLRNHYYPGSLYDVLNNAPTCWLIIIALGWHHLEDEEQPDINLSLRWTAVWSILSALAVISVPIMGIWTLLQVNEPPALQHFRIAVTFVASALLAFCVFSRQRLMDQRLVGLVATSQETLDNLQRVHAELVRTERLGSLGQLVAGAAHEINNPLTAILGYSDLLTNSASLSPEQTSVATTIAQEARRARNLVADLLGFANKAPGERSLVDAVSLLQRAVQIESGNSDRTKVQIVAGLSQPVPRVYGSTSELFQACLQLLSGIADRLETLGGGTLLVRTSVQGNDVCLEFSCLDPAGRPIMSDASPCREATSKNPGLRFRAVQSIIDHHAGHITVPDSSRIVVSLPTAAQVAASAARN